MSIIVQAGHKTSKSKQLMEKLYERGLSRPADSYTNKMTPEQVSETLYKVLSRENTSPADEKMADNVMTDFLLANLDAKNWGWEAARNLFSLDYWQQMDPNIGFIFVFDSPAHVLTTIEGSLLTVDFVDNAMEEWIQYHQIMLSLIEKYEDNVILVEGAYAIDNISKLSEPVKRIASTLHLKSSWQVASIVTSHSDGLKTNSDEYADVTTSHISNEILRKYPEAIRVFNLLLSKTSVKSSEPIYKTKHADLDSLLSALKYLNRNKSKNFELLEDQNKLLKEKLEATDLEKKRVVKQSLVDQKLINQYKTKLDQLRKSESSTDTSISKESLKKENDMLLEQLHHTQEELEKYYLKSQSQLSTLSDKKDTGHQQSKPEAYYGAAERVKSELAYRIGEKMVKARKPKDIIALPLVLIKEYQNYEIKKEDFYDLPDIKEYNDFDEGRKVKEHLSYRIGSLFLNTSKSPVALLMMPLNVGKEVVSFRMKRKK